MNKRSPWYKKLWKMLPLTFLGKTFRLSELPTLLMLKKDLENEYNEEAEESEEEDLYDWRKK
jgi:hypothetical protein